jgi:hypothetical protein
MAEHESGKMDIRHQQETFAGFVQAIVYFCTVVAIVLLFLALVNA